MLSLGILNLMTKSLASPTTFIMLPDDAIEMPVNYAEAYIASFSTSRMTTANAIQLQYAK